jgi:hypothetical protein
MLDHFLHQDGSTVRLARSALGDDAQDVRQRVERQVKGSRDSENGRLLVVLLDECVSRVNLHLRSSAFFALISSSLSGKPGIRQGFLPATAVFTRIVVQIKKLNPFAKYEHTLRANG